MSATVNPDDMMKASAIYNLFRHAMKPVQGWRMAKVAQILAEHREAAEHRALGHLAEGWTVKAEDYDRLKTDWDALTHACRTQLPPGYYALIENETRLTAPISTNASQTTAQIDSGFSQT